MIRRDGNRMVVSGPLNLTSVAQALAQGKAAIAEGVGEVDFAEVSELDSSALALLLAWQREARRRGGEFAVSNLPQGLTTIARVYGVAELLPGASSSAHH
jgi:phospholipid transport system transporter-binding protein